MCPAKHEVCDINDKKLDDQGGFRYSVGDESIIFAIAEE